MKRRDVPPEARPKSFGVSQHPCNELVLEMRLARLTSFLLFDDNNYAVARVAERNADVLEKKLSRP